VRLAEHDEHPKTRVALPNQVKVARQGLVSLSAQGRELVDPEEMHGAE
jgi:hypothetical protein